MKEKTIHHLVQLGELLSQTDAFSTLFEQAYQQNSWFTPANLQFAFQVWSEALSEPNVRRWLSAYPEYSVSSPKRVLVVMAGNIPLVGFHDLLCVLAAGHRAMVKLSSNDAVLLPALVAHLRTFAPEWAEAVHFSDERITDFDMVLATGSNNTARYFEYYFGQKPHIIRKNRNSVAVLTGHETPEALLELGRDLFQYYGLGCRSVSKLFVPKDYNFDFLFKAIYPYRTLIEEQKYANNYDYNKAVYLMSQFKLLENGFLLLKEDRHYASPIATLFYEYYTDVALLQERLRADANQIQCVVGEELFANAIPFGYTQMPQLWDYADGVDTMQFLLEC